MGESNAKPGDFERLVDGLRDPAVYDHAVSRVAVIETHISAVLLAGEFVYKVKKPVDFGFVDFTTLAKRRHFCDEELRLNRRFAPALYLDVVAIHGSSDSPRLGGDGPAVEYAVRMRRFDQDALLDRCIGEPGRVTPPMIEAFAGDVAAVHAQAAAAAPADGYGTPEAVARSVADCWPPIRDAGLVNREPRFERLADYMDSRGRSLEAVIAGRLEDGRVRECHGDLHLGNLFLADGAIRAFDCIEFNQALRWIDVANDIAFTTMDLRYHGHAGLARRFRSAYLDASGDYGLLRVLPYYEVYRALVRAKVAALREGGEPGAGRDDARRHLSLAADLVQVSSRPALIVTCGLSGSGKTCATSELVACSEAIRIRSDIERNRRPAGPGERYSDAGIEAVYERLLDQARRIIDAGYPVIVDATFIKRARRDRFRELADELRVPFHIFHCTASEDVLRQRIRRRAARGSDASEADLAVLDGQLREIEPPAADEQDFVVPYDTESPPLLGSVIPALDLDPGARGD